VWFGKNKVFEFDVKTLGQRASVFWYALMCHGGRLWVGSILTAVSTGLWGCRLRLLQTCCRSSRWVYQVASGRAWWYVTSHEWMMGASSAVAWQLLAVKQQTEAFLRGDTKPVDDGWVCAGCGCGGVLAAVLGGEMCDVCVSVSRKR